MTETSLIIHGPESASACAERAMPDGGNNLSESGVVSGESCGESEWKCEKCGSALDDGASLELMVCGTCLHALKAHERMMILEEARRLARQMQSAAEQSGTGRSSLPPGDRE